MKIRTKIILSLVITALVILVSYVVFLGIKIQRDRLLLESFQQQLNLSITTAVNINEKSFMTILRDYSCWDEMVSYTKTADTNWYRLNISTVPTIHNLTGMWIISPEGRIIHAFNQDESAFNNANLFNDSLFSRIADQRMLHFFDKQSNRIFEFAASTIQPTMDTLKKQDPSGFLIFCRRIDRQYLSWMEEISASRVFVLPISKSQTPSSSPSEIISLIPLHAWNNQPVCFLEFRREQPLVKAYMNITNATSSFYLILALLILIIFSFLLLSWLTIPLRRITESLALEDGTLIRGLIKKRNEFGKISMMIERFFYQKKELADIIHEKNEVLNSYAIAESKNTALLSAIPDLLFRINLFGIITDYHVKNPEDLPVPPDSLVGKNIEEILPHSITPVLQIALRDVNTTRSPQVLDFSLPFPNGQSKYYEASLTLTSMGDYLAVVRNITTRKEAELALNRMLEKEAELNRLKTQFIATVSHEFRTPLSAISSNLQLLDLYDDTWSVEKKTTAILRIHHAVKEMITLLNDLSVVAKDQSGKLTINPTVFNLELFCGELIKDAAVIVDPLANIKFEFTCKYSEVTLDKELLRYILSNLLSNAIKFTPGNEEVLLAVSNPDDQTIQIVLSDRGIGISQEDLSNIFEPFHRGGNVAEFPGTGLGLSIVKRCVDLHKGSVSITSELGKGTRITVLLPLLSN